MFLIKMLGYGWYGTLPLIRHNMCSKIIGLVSDGCAHLICARLLMCTLESSLFSFLLCLPRLHLYHIWYADTCNKHITTYNIHKEFIESCHDTALEFPTSFYGVAMNGQSWTIETKLNRVGGESGWIATQVIKTISSDGRMRRWQWELRKNKRPPCLGCWKIESIGSSDRNGDFEARDRGDGWSD